MSNKKYFFVVFEGIEGSGKSYQSKKLNHNLKKKGLSTVLTREPGGFPSAESIRKLILTGKSNKFSMRTDTLLYLASRNEHFEKKIKPAIKKKKLFYVIDLQILQLLTKCMEVVKVNYLFNIFTNIY